MRKIIFLLFVIFFAVGCEDDSPGNLLFNSPECSIVDRTELMIPYFGFPRMEFLVENDGDGPTAFGITVCVKLKRGNYIVDESSVYLGELRWGESKSGDALFTKVRSRYDFDKVEVDMYWYDAEGRCYEK